MILQHVAERDHPFNTARIVKEALRRCELIVDDNKRLGDHMLTLHPNVGLLYPRSDAPSLAELPAHTRPKQLVVIDGTWHQAKTIVRDVPQLQGMPCFRLSPSSPSRYRIRKEPDKRSLSTLEATVSALRALEPETEGLDQLLNAFDKMVDDQLNHRGSRVAWRKRKERTTRPRHAPLAMLDNEKNLVVAYGEATPHRPGRLNRPSHPVSWVAQRLGTSDRFSRVIRQSSPLPDAALGHMRLTKADFQQAVTPDEFRDQWNEFIRPDDVLIVYHERTFRLLQSIAPSPSGCLALKAIFGQRKVEFHSLEELIKFEGLELSLSTEGSRADERLAMAALLVEHLQSQYQAVAKSS